MKCLNFYYMNNINLQENIHRIQQMMGILSEDSSTYTVPQIQKGLNKSVKDNDIIINTSIENIINNIDKFEFEIGSVDSFLDDDSNFIFESLPDKLISYIREKGLDIDISKLIEYNNYRKEYNQNEDRISQLRFNTHPDEDYSNELELLYDRNEKIYKYFDLLRNEILDIKKQITNQEI